MDHAQGKECEPPGLTPLLARARVPAAGRAGAPSSRTLFHHAQERERLDRLRRGEPCRRRPSAAAAARRSRLREAQRRRGGTAFVDGAPVHVDPPEAKLLEPRRCAAIPERGPSCASSASPRASGQAPTARSARAILAALRPADGVSMGLRIGTRRRHGDPKAGGAALLLALVRSRSRSFRGARWRSPRRAAPRAASAPPPGRSRRRATRSSPTRPTGRSMRAWGPGISLPRSRRRWLGGVDLRLALRHLGQAERLGRLPWKTLGLPDLRDGDGERLWYAVSSATRACSTAPRAARAST
jgi:hypothetical protein